MGYLTVNTRSNRVVIISSITARIFFNSVQCLDGHISTYFNKDTCDLFMLCIVLMCQLHRVVFIIVVSLFCLLFDFPIHLLFDFCFIRFFCFSLFIVCCSKEKYSILTLDCIPGISILLYHCTRSTIIIYASQ
jgi:hypothetical protein